MFALQSIVLAFLGRFFFNEHVHWFHYLGISLMFACATCIGLGKQHKPFLEAQEEHFNTISPAIAILISLVTPCLFALTTVWVRISKIKGQIHPSNLTLASNFTVSVIMVVIAFATIPLEQFKSEIFLRMLIASFLSIIAMMCYANATATGYAGPVSALCSV